MQCVQHNGANRFNALSVTVCYPLSVSPTFTLERALAGFARAGLRYAELVAIPGYCPHLQPDQMGEPEIDAVRRLLQQYNLTPNVINADANLTTEAGVEFLGQAMRVAGTLGVDRVVTHIEQTETEVGVASFRAFLPKIVALGEQDQMVIALETHGGLINTGTAGIKLLRELNLDCLKLT